MSDRNLAAACGLYCGPCQYLGNKCNGCGHEKGNPFWTSHAKVEICPLYDCCVNRKKLEHCGLCPELPCTMFKEFHDPSLSPEEAKKSVLARQSELMRRKVVGTDKWLESER